MRHLGSESNIRERITHIILDEVHERELTTDILLTIIKYMLNNNAEIKIVLMSATLDTDLFNTYFGGDLKTIDIPGRTYEVEKIYLEEILAVTKHYSMNVKSGTIDHQLLLNLISLIHDHTPTKETILVFLPGIGSIMTQSNAISHKLPNCKIMVLHSEASGDQECVFATNPKLRKIILSTNIAETSLTIGDVKHVIDCGFVKSIVYDAKTDSKQLVESRISRASADQRAGRTGRTENGRCYRLYSKQTYDSMERHTMAQILKSPLMNTSLLIKSVIKDQNIEEFLTQTIEPPSVASVTASIKMLKIIGALDSEENITKFGTFALALPIEIKYAKAILLSIGLRCLETVMYIISMLSSTACFKIGTSTEERTIISTAKKQFGNGAKSDYMVLWKIYCDFIDQYEKHKFCAVNGLSFTSMDIAHRVFNLLKQRLASLAYPHTRSKINYGSINVNGKNWDIVHMCLAASLFPNICHVTYNDDNGARELRSRFNESVTITNSIVRVERLKLDAFVIYEEKNIGINGPTIKNAAMIPAIVVLLVCGNSNHVDNETGIVTIGDVCQIKIDIPVLDILMDVRARLETLINEALEDSTTFNLTHETGRELAKYLSEIIAM